MTLPDWTSQITLYEISIALVACAALIVAWGRVKAALFPDQSAALKALRDEIMAELRLIKEEQRRMDREMIAFTAADYKERLASLEKSVDKLREWLIERFEDRR